MAARLAQWNRGAGFAAIRADWLARAAGIGKPIRVQSGDGELAGQFETHRRDGPLGSAPRRWDTADRDGGRRVHRCARQGSRRMAGPQGELVFAPLGGVGEIGMNLSIYGLGDERRRTWLIVDVGVSFAQRGEPAGHRPDLARHPLSGRGAPQHRRHRAHPRARGPFRRAARPLAAS